MNVLILSHLFPPHGGTFVLDQMKALREQGVALQVIAPTPWAPPFFRSLPRLQPYVLMPHHDEVEGFDVEYPRFGCLPHSRMFYALGLSFYMRCRSLVHSLMRTRKLDLIHAHTVMPDGFAAVCLGHEFNLPVVCTIHGSDINLYPSRNRPTLWTTRWSLAHLRHLVAVSSALKNKILEFTANATVQVLHNGADPRVFKPLSKLEARAKLGLPLRTRIILFVGNLVEMKGVRFLLEAVASLQQNNTKLVLVGDGELRDPLLACAERLGITPMCSFVGKRPHQEIAYWLSAADCLVLPSISEGLPTILPEAMLCRTPILATTVGGIPEIIDNTRNGLLVPPRDTHALTDALRSLLGDQENASRMAKEAESKARRSLTWEAHARELFKIYEHAAHAA